MDAVSFCGDGRMMVESYRGIAEALFVEVLHEEYKTHHGQDGAVNLPQHALLLLWGVGDFDGGLLPNVQVLTFMVGALARFGASVRRGGFWNAHGGGWGVEGSGSVGVARRRGDVQTPRTRRVQHSGSNDNDGDDACRRGVMATRLGLPDTHVAMGYEMGYDEHH